MKPIVSLRKALSDERLMGHVMTADSYRAQKTLAIAAMGEDLTDDERPIFTKFTGREHEPRQRVKEFAIVSGRRTAKTLTAATLATYLGACVDYRDVLVAAETGVVLCLAQDQKIATKILDWTEDNLMRSPILGQRFVGRTQDTIELTNNISIEVRPASAKKLRGPTYCAILADELSFWYVEDFYANPDTEVLAAARPGLLTTRGPLIMMSSPYAKRGVLWETFNKHYGPNGSPTVLVAKGTTAELNPTIEQAEIDAELERDPVRNRAEYLAEFRSDVSGYVPPEAVLACVSKNIYERLPQSDQTYHAFCDPSAGSVDSMTLAVAHLDYARQVVVLDCIREARPPFSPEQTCDEFADVLRRYRLTSVVGDRFGGAWCIEQFARFGVIRTTASIIHATASTMSSIPRLAHASSRCSWAASTFPVFSRVLLIAICSTARLRNRDINAEWRRARLAAYVVSGGRIIS